MRRVLFRSPDMQEVVESPDSISKLWSRREYHCNWEWRYFLQFAAFCLASNEIIASLELEKIRPNELGDVCDQGLSIIERLLGFCNE